MKDIHSAHLLRPTGHRCDAPFESWIKKFLPGFHKFIPSMQFIQLVPAPSALITDFRIMYEMKGIDWTLLLRPTGHRCDAPFASWSNKRNKK
jgi:hypothetical protein